MKTTLKHIAEIQTGLFAKTVSNGDIVSLQARHFDEYGQLIAELHPDLKADKIAERHLLKHGDVLFAAKGNKNFAAYYESKNLPAVASTSFFVIRMKEEYHNLILPGFLVWFINNPETQKFLKDNAIGSSIASISKAVLEELEISIPDLQKQKTILKIIQLRNAEKKIIQQIQILKEKQIQQKIINALK
ncbi:MAG: restriction endonuclease subunit S [Bacteroidetes bacterium]|nr:restriction endonuclease subunit S [Bacteroidota bacterium]